MTATLPSKRNKSMVGRCPECLRPTTPIAVTGGAPTFPRSSHSADGWRCADHARTDAERRKRTVTALAQVAEFTLPFCGLVA